MNVRTALIINAYALWLLGLFANACIWLALLRRWRWRSHLPIMGMEMVSLGLIVVHHFVHFRCSPVWWTEMDIVWVVWAVGMAAVFGFLENWCRDCILLFFGYALIAGLGVAEHFKAQDMEFIMGAAREAACLAANRLYFAREWISRVVAFGLAWSLYYDTIRNPDKEPKCPTNMNTTSTTNTLQMNPAEV